MSEFYTHRSGVVEQVRYYRRQPEYLRHLPWGFEIKRHYRHKRIIDFTLASAGVVALIVFYAFIYW